MHIEYPCELGQSVSNHAHEVSIANASHSHGIEGKVYIIHLMRQIIFSINKHLASGEHKTITNATPYPSFFHNIDHPPTPQRWVAPSSTYNTFLEPSHSHCVSLVWK